MVALKPYTATRLTHCQGVYIFVTKGTVANRACIELNAFVDLLSNRTHLRKVGHYWIVSEDDRIVVVAEEATIN